MNKVTSEATPSLNQFTKSNDLEWRPLAEPGVTGVWVKVLRYDRETRRAPTIMLKFEAGATYPAHNHPGGEELFVLQGSVHVGKDHLQAGDYLYTAPNNKHGVRAVEETIVLVSVPEQVEIIYPKQ